MGSVLRSTNIELTKPPLQQVMALCTIVMTQPDLSRPSRDFQHLVVGLTGSVEGVHYENISIGLRNMTGIERAVVMVKAGVAVTRIADMLNVDHQVLRRALATYVRKMNRDCVRPSGIEFTIETVPLRCFMMAGAIGMFPYDECEIRSVLRGAVEKRPSQKTLSEYRKLYRYMD